MSSCVTWQRISYDKGWTGRNRLKGVDEDASHDERDAISKCNLCDFDEDMDHTLRYCLNAELDTIRIETIAALSTLIIQIHHDKNRILLEEKFAEALRDIATPSGKGYHEGWRAWTGQWTPHLITQLYLKFPLDDNLSQDHKQRLKRTALQVGTILAQGARAIWASICRQISLQKLQARLELHRKTKYIKAHLRNNKKSKFIRPQNTIRAFLIPKPIQLNPQPEPEENSPSLDTLISANQPSLKNVPSFIKYQRRKPKTVNSKSTPHSLTVNIPPVKKKYPSCANKLHTHNCPHHTIHDTLSLIRGHIGI